MNQINQLSDESQTLIQNKKILKLHKILSLVLEEKKILKKNNKLNPKGEQVYFLRSLLTFFLSINPLHFDTFLIQEFFDICTRKQELRKNYFFAVY